MDRFDKFTDRARKVLTLAQDEAQRFNHNYIARSICSWASSARARASLRVSSRT
jgi:hypothetical protein